MGLHLDWTSAFARSAGHGVSLTGAMLKAVLGGFVRLFVGRAWSLYKPLDQGTKSAPQSTEAAEEISLGDGAQQGQQRGPAGAA